jgi:hypothetical protein
MRLLSAIPWLQWLPAGTVGALLVWSVANLPSDFGSRHLQLRGGCLVAALALCFALDDPAAPTSDPVPARLITRRLIRVGLSLVPWVMMVVVLLLDAGSAGQEGRLVLEAATLAGWGLAMAAVIARRWDPSPGWRAATALLAAYAVSWAIPESHRPWALPGDIRWAGLLPWWWWSLALGAVVFVAASWDTRI